jgi:alpha-1,3-rhamnosyl/mannosyltransferase
VSSRRLRIGIVTDGLEEREQDGVIEVANGGVGVYIHRLLSELLEIAAADLEITLIHCGPARLDVYRDPRARVVTIPFSPLHRYSRWVDVPYARLARALGLDLVHYPNQFGGAGLPLAIRRVVTLHDLTPLRFPHFHPWRTVLGYRVLLRRSLRRANRVIVDSETTRRELLDEGLASAAKVTAIPLGVADAFREAASNDGFARRRGLPERFVLSVGVLEPRKNHRLLVEALGILHERSEPIALVIAGRDGWGWTDPLSDPAPSRLRSSVHVLRNVPDAEMPSLYRSAAVFAYPSFHEGFGLPLAEAMASGTPVVTSSVSSLPEVAGDAALFANPNDATSFAEAMLRVLRDPMLRADLVARGKQRVADLTWRRTAERTLAVYEEVCAGR